jgi:uncharacterized membrane-anchored protein
MLSKITLTKVIEARILFGVLLVILLLANFLIVAKQRALADGNVMLLELAPRDPRSILQGDYMVLRYRIANLIARHSSDLTEDGYVVVALDNNNVATFERIHDSSTPLKENENLLLYRKRNGVVKVATNAFFFQEQHGKYYSAARYGELRVSNGGDAVLTGLRDAKFQVLTPADSEDS